MDSAVVEAVPAATNPPSLCSLAVTIQIARSRIHADIVLSRNEERFLRPCFPQDLIGRVELRSLGELRDVSGMEQERRLDGHRIDLSDRGAKRGGHVGVCGFVEADVTVADLHEEEVS